MFLIVWNPNHFREPIQLTNFELPKMIMNIVYKCEMKFPENEYI